MKKCHGEGIAKLTDKQRAVLAAIASEETAVQAFLLYPIISPQGKYIERDRGPTRGGPSGREVAVHFWMNKEPMRQLVKREAIMHRGRIVAQGGYMLTYLGKKVLRGVG